LLGFFTTITAVKIDKAVTTKDKAWPTSTYSSRVSMQGLRGEGSNPHNSGGAFSEWFCQREATWWTYLRQATRPSASRAATRSRPPVGHRSMGGTGPHYGLRWASAGDAAKALNAANLTVVMLETSTAIDNADAIAAVPGFNVLPSEPRPCAPKWASMAH
jgi:hypothetical protein